MSVKKEEVCGRIEPQKKELTEMRYSTEYKDQIMRRMLPPNNESIQSIAQAEGLSEQTLRNWREKARMGGVAALGNGNLSEDWSTQDKFLIVVETAGLNQSEMGEYARKKGLYVEQILTWRDACMNANGGVAQEAARLHKELKQVQKTKAQLEKELIRKEKALAESAALLLLRKNMEAIWGEGVED